MKNILKVLIPVVAIALAVNQFAIAQVDGYRFGVGLGYAGRDGAYDHNSNGRNFFGLPIAPTPRLEQPPFFAQYPPVYYSPTIVPRAYGVSPYAAPAGITPVEMGGPGPMYQVNPYYVEPSNNLPMDNPPEPKPTENGNDKTPKTTWIQNPYFDSLATSVGDEVALK